MSFQNSAKVEDEIGREISTFTPVLGIILFFVLTNRG